jgi:pimeloyl-ACP methyl ester carboxylesterase
VEYAEIGSGPPVLLLHGGLGGWDQGLVLGVPLLSDPEEQVDYQRAVREGDALLRDRFTLISPSRVGYLRTPLSTGRTPAEGADAAAALLDQLGLTRALVVGVSGGGPTALEFALRHPARCAALVMVAAITKRHLQPVRITDSIIGRLLFGRRGGWLLDLGLAIGLAYVAVRPLSFAKLLLNTTEALSAEMFRERARALKRHPEQLQWMRGLIESLYPLRARRVGLENDLAQFALIEDYPIGQINCPTLVVHGRHDDNVPIAQAEFVARGVPGAELVVAETCGHLIWMSDEEPRLRRVVQQFLTWHSKSSRPRESLRREAAQAEAPLPRDGRSARPNIF